MSLLVTRTEQWPDPAAALSPAQTLVQAVAKAIAEADDGRRFGCYDYSRYPGDAPPYVIRDEIARKELFRSWDHEACQAEYKRVTEEWVATCALKAVYDWRMQHDPDRAQG